MQCLYRASDGVLANSGIEPFGLVGLEAMACGGLSFLGATGEDYATPGHDAISLQSGSPGELVERLLYLREHPDLGARLRHAARRTAARFTTVARRPTRSKPSAATERQRAEEDPRQHEKDALSAFVVVRLGAGFGHTARRSERWLSLTQFCNRPPDRYVSATSPPLKRMS